MDDTTQSLRDELDAALADLENAASLTEINQTLVDMLEVMKSRKPGDSPPVINVTVSPTPIQNTLSVQRVSYAMRFDYDEEGRITAGHITPDGDAS